MKNLLIVVGLGLAVYGGYLFLTSKKKDDDDCGCGCGGGCADAAKAVVPVSTAIGAANTDMMPESAVEQYDSNFNSIFIGRGQGNYSAGASTTDDANASMVTEATI